MSLTLDALFAEEEYVNERILEILHSNQNLWNSFYQEAPFLRMMVEGNLEPCPPELFALIEIQSELLGEIKKLEGESLNAH